MHIIGAGMAGLLAGHMCRLEKPQIHEKQTSLPNNHDALLRFRTNNVARETATKFREVLVRKNVVWQDRMWSDCSINLANMYSLKVTGRVSNRSIWDLAPVTRYIAPPNLVAKMATGLDIKYSEEIGWEGIKARGKSGPVISTIPLPIIMEMSDYPNKDWARSFHYKPIWSVNVDIRVPEVDVYQTLYYPNPSLPYYRASFTGNILTIEYIKEPNLVEVNIEDVCSDFGLPDIGVERGQYRFKEQKFGKIMPGPEHVRKHFISWLTCNHNIYSLGRYATWRNILLDDVVKDVNQIHKLIAYDGRTRLFEQLLA